MENGEVTITASPNGPYLVQGVAKIIDPEGNEYSTEGKMVALCRCGGSQRKPFCDGTHSKIGFQAAEAAVEELERRKKA